MVKVTDLTVTLCNWNSAPWNTGTGSFGVTQKLGVLTLHTDEGLQGHSCVPGMNGSLEVKVLYPS